MKRAISVLLIVVLVGLAPRPVRAHDEGILALAGSLLGLGIVASYFTSRDRENTNRLAITKEHETQRHQIDANTGLAALNSGVNGEGGIERSSEGNANVYARGISPVVSPAPAPPASSAPAPPRGYERTPSPPPGYSYPEYPPLNRPRSNSARSIRYGNEGWPLVQRGRR